MAAPEPAASTSSTRRTIEIVVLAVGVVAFLALSVAKKRPADAPPDYWLQRIGVILAAGLTLIMYSFLYRDNPLFKVAENLFVGVALGYGAIITWRESLRPEIMDPLFIDPPHFHAFLMEFLRRLAPILLGILLVTRLSRRLSWLSRYSYTLMVGWGAGIGIPIVVHTYILQQLQASVSPLNEAVGVLPVFGAIVILAGTVSVLFYFFFSVEHKGAGGAVSTVGIWFLMISFGASFGYTVMGRISLLIGRVEFLLKDWFPWSL